MVRQIQIPMVTFCIRKYNRTRIPESLRFSTTNIKVHNQTSATLNQSELQFKSSANARKLLDQYPIYD